MEDIWIDLAAKFKQLGAAQPAAKIAATLKEHSHTRLRSILDKYRGFGNDASNVSLDLVVLLASREGDGFKAILGVKSPLVRLAVIHYEPDNEV